jgi:hypothetical protein
VPSELCSEHRVFLEFSEYLSHATIKISNHFQIWGLESSKHPDFHNFRKWSIWFFETGPKTSLERKNDSSRRLILSRNGYAYSIKELATSSGGADSMRTCRTIISDSSGIALIISFRHRSIKFVNFSAVIPTISGVFLFLSLLMF